MNDVVGPVARQSLSDRLAARIRSMIHRGDFRVGERLPAIMEIARDFGVGHPTVREALKQLETIGVVEIRHGSGVYVRRSDDVLVLATPGYAGPVSRKLLLDLIQARIPLEMRSVAGAAENATPADLKELRRILAMAGEHLGDDDVLNTLNMSFHRQIAIASGNTVLVQLLDVLRELFADERRLIIDISGSRKKGHRDHLAIFEAVEQRDATLAVERMRTHLEGVLTAIRRWDPERRPAG